MADSSGTSASKALEDAEKKIDSAKEASDDLQESAKEVEKSTKDAAKEVEKSTKDAAKEVEKSTKDAAKELEKSATDAAKELEKLTTDAAKQVQKSTTDASDALSSADTKEGGHHNATITLRNETGFQLVIVNNEVRDGKIHKAPTAISPKMQGDILLRSKGRFSNIDVSVIYKVAERKEGVKFRITTAVRGYMASGLKNTRAECTGLIAQYVNDDGEPTNSDEAEIDGVAYDLFHGQLEGAGVEKSGPFHRVRKAVSRPNIDCSRTIIFRKKP